MVHAFRIGITASEFWQMTFLEINSMTTIFQEKQKEKQDDLITQAYLTAYYQRVKDMPKLKDVLQVKSENKNQTAHDMLKVIQAMNHAFNGSTY